MSDIEEGPIPPHREIGTPSAAPNLLPAEQGAGGEVAEGSLPSGPEFKAHADRAAKLVAVCFIIAFLAGCGFIAAYVGLEVHSVDATLRSNLALGTSLSVVLLGLGFGSIIYVRHVMPDVEIEEERHDMNSTPEARQAFQEYAVEGGRASQLGKQPLVRRTLMLAGLPLVAAPVVLLRDLGPLPGTSLRHTVWSPGRRLLLYGTNEPVTPSSFEPGSMITIVPEGYQDDADALAKATVICIKFRPNELHIPQRIVGGTLVSTQNWAIGNSLVAYSKICTHVGCPVALYEQTTHHILCPCHQSTFDAATGATVIFGPAPRPLPQLPIAVNDDGYLVATSDFTQPVGPSFWERG